MPRVWVCLDPHAVVFPPPRRGTLSSFSSQKPLPDPLLLDMILTFPKARAQPATAQLYRATTRAKLSYRPPSASSPLLNQILSSVPPILFECEHITWSHVDSVFLTLARLFFAIVAWISVFLMEVRLTPPSPHQLQRAIPHSTIPLNYHSHSLRVTSSHRISTQPALHLQIRMITATTLASPIWSLQLRTRRNRETTRSRPLHPHSAAPHPHSMDCILSPIPTIQTDRTRSVSMSS